MKTNHVIRASDMNDAKYTVISRCLSLAKAALESRWTFHNSTEALFWFRSVLKVDPKNATARLGSARVYQYVASQPWWHNNVSLAKSAASKALGMLDEPSRTESVVESREKALVRGQIYSAIGQPNVAKKYLNEGINIDPRYSSGYYFLHFNDIFIDPRAGGILPGLNEAVEIAEAEGSQRRLAAALYFRGFANTLFSNYHEAIEDLKRSMTMNPGYGSANLALIGATALARHKQTYKIISFFKERYPNFDQDILDYMWVDRSSCSEYQRLVRPVVETVKVRLGSERLGKA
jgi:tetratricopeptide (TPR) repeat protein